MKRPATSAVGVGGVLVRAAGAWRRLPKHLGAIAFAALFFQALFGTAFAYSLKLIVDDLMGKPTTLSLDTLLVLLLAGFVVLAAATVVGERAVAKAGGLVLSDLYRRAYSRVAHASPQWLISTPPGKIVGKFAGNAVKIESGYTKSFLNFVVFCMTFSVALPVLFLIDWRLALAAAAVLPLVVLLSRWLTPYSMAANQAASDTEGYIFGAVEDTARAYQVIRTFRLERALEERFDALIAEQRRLTVHARTVSAAVGKGASLSALLIRLAFVSTGALLAAHGVLSAGDLIAFLTILGLLTGSVYDISRTEIPALAECGRAIKRFESVLTAPLETADAPGAKPLPRVHGSVSFDRVSFEYARGGRPALEEVSFEVPAGATAALVGRNGSGKTTLLMMLMRFYDPANGRICIDGRDVKEATQESVREQLSAVFQDNFVFQDTVRANIGLYRPWADDMAIVAAARDAELDEWVTALPDGYDTNVGIGGGRLSGGHKQRLAIARALVGDPAILLLDEAASALDPATEATVNAMLRRLGNGRTVISATHRLAFATGADVILVMDNGRLVQQGTHDALLAEAGAYRELWEKQSGFEVSGDGRQARVDATRLRGITLFSDLPDTTLEQIARGLDSEYVDSDQVVFREGDPGDRFYLLARGSVEVMGLAPDGSEHRLEVLSDGDHFGEMALLLDRPRTATIRTRVPSLFLTMGRGEFLDLVRDTPEMIRMLEERLTRSERNLAEFRASIGETEPPR